MSRLVLNEVGPYKAAIALLVIASLVAVSGIAYAKWQETHWMSCSGGNCANNSRQDWYIDDCNGKLYCIWVHCDCSTTIQFVSNVTVAPGPFYYPANYQQLCMMADLVTPGAFTGVYFYDSHGQEIRVRNPHNQAEIDAVMNCGAIQ